MATRVFGPDRAFRTTVDLATTNYQYYIVKRGSNDTDADVVLASAGTDKSIGTLNEVNKATGSVDVALRSGGGTIKVKLGGTVATGAYITSNASGLGIATTTSGDQILGMALYPGVSGDVIEILPMNRIV